MSTSAADPQAKDPVCGMTVDPERARYSLTHAGQNHYFCSEGCQTKFAADPEYYLSGQAQRDKAAAAQSAPEGTTWTCPMHPEVQEPEAGSCPFCGMALEPMMVTADSGPNPELIDMNRRFWVGLVLAFPVFLLEMGSHVIPALHGWIPARSSYWIQLVLTTPVVFWCGWPFFERGWPSLVTRNLNMFTLIAMGTGVAWLYSTVAVLALGIFPDAFRASDGTVAVYFE